jgi:hypothetical protein
MDVKKLGRIPDGGGWRAHGLAATTADKHRRPKIGFDYVHSVVDDHPRLAYSETHPEERAPTCAAFFARALDYFTANGITNVERLITDNARSYRHGAQLRDLLKEGIITHKFIKPHGLYAANAG